MEMLDPGGISPEHAPQMVFISTDPGVRPAVFKVCGTADGGSMDVLPGFGDRLRNRRKECQKKESQQRSGEQQ